MIEVFKHLFVWLVSPAAVCAVAIYALYRKEFFLGTLASGTMLIVVAAAALWLFDGHLLIYQLIYTALGGVPALMGLVTVIQWVGLIFRSIRKSPVPEV